MKQRFLFLLSLLAIPAYAAISPVTGELPVNTTVQDNQVRAEVAMDASGNHVVVWETYGLTSVTGIYGQRFDANGNKVGGEFRIDQGQAETNWNPAIAMNGLGRFVVVWEGYNNGEFNESEVYGRVYNAAGVAQGDVFVVNEITVDDQDEADIAIDSAGNFTVVWTSRRDFDGSRGIYARRFYADGTPIAGEFNVQSSSAGTQSNPAIAIGASNEMVIAWENWQQTRGVYARRFDAVAQPVASQFRVSYLAQNEESPDVVIGDSGQFIVAWTHRSGSSASTNSLYLHAYDELGNSIHETKVIDVRSSSSSTEIEVTLVKENSDTYVMSWDSNETDVTASGVFAQKLDNLGQPVGMPAKVAEKWSAQGFLSTNGAGRFVASWRYWGQDGSSDYGIFERVFQLDTDDDGLIDFEDNCALVANAGQLDNDSDGIGDACDDSDEDGLSDEFELSIGTNLLLADSDGDTISDYDEVAYDGDATSYTVGQDINPLSVDTDGDGVNDNLDPIPLAFNFNDGDVAPLNSPDGIVNAADYLVQTQVALGLIPISDVLLAHGDLYPQGAPDGEIGVPDLILLMRLVFE